MDVKWARCSIIFTLWWTRNCYHWCKRSAGWGWKRPVHYCSRHYWRLPLQQWRDPITASEWITNMPRTQIDRAKGGRCQWVTLILYLRLMNICGTMAANPSGHSIKGGGRRGRKIILWWIKRRRDTLCFGHCRALAWCAGISWCVVFARFSNPPTPSQRTRRCGNSFRSFVRTISRIL